MQLSFYDETTTNSWEVVVFDWLQTLNPVNI